MRLPDDLVIDYTYDNLRQYNLRLRWYLIVEWGIDMGTWGTGIFDNDSASEFRDNVMLQMRRYIRDCFDKYEEGNFKMGEHGISILMPSVDILIALCSYYDVDPDLTVQEAKSWKNSYLDIYDQEIHIMGAEESFNQERRTIIVETFDKLISIAEMWD